MTEINYKEVIREEIKKCFLDPAYFCHNYCHIIHQKRGEILFNLFPFQEDVLKKFQIKDRIIILKSRQLGLSTLCAAFALWLTLFHPAKNVLFVSKRAKDATGLITKVSVMYNGLPSWLKTFANIIENNRQSIGFSNNSRIAAESTTTDTGRSTSNALVILDEFAFTANGSGPQQRKLLAAVLQSAQTGKVFILSTPNGTGDAFSSTWFGAIANENPFFPIKLRWDVHPEHDQKWRDEQTKELGEKLASQECDCEFLSSGASVIDPKLLKQFEQNFVCEPILKKGPGNNLWIWKLPVPGREYIIPADVARGDGSDYSGCHVIDKEDVEQVAEFKMQLGTREYAQFLFNLGIEYNNALLVVENASMGWDVVQELINLGYPNLYYSNPALLFSSTNNNFIPFDGSAKLIPGFTNSSKTRPMIIAKLETYSIEQACIYHSERLNAELFVFIWHRGKAQAQQGYNDDLVLPWATGLFIRDTFSKFNKNSLQLTGALINSIGSSISTGLHEREKQSLLEKNFEMPDGKGGTESLNWLLDNPNSVPQKQVKKEHEIPGLIWLG
jgi:hypothetical protein